jgi:hypothetical protein
LSFCTDDQQGTHVAVSMLDRGTRLVTRLHTLSRRCSWSMLGHLCLAIAQHGKPRKPRTDNEAIFNSWVINGFAQAFDFIDLPPTLIFEPCSDL